jgi:hypothetical protein
LSSFLGTIFANSTNKQGMNVPAKKGIQPNTQEIERLIAAKGGRLKQLVDPHRRKTLYRARKGSPISQESMNYLAQALGVEVTEISILEGQETPYQRTISLKLMRMDSLKGFPEHFFENSDEEDLDLLNPPGVEARFEVEDPTEERTEAAAIVVELVETMTMPQKASEKIRTFGKLNSAIQKLKEANMLSSNIRDLTVS